MHDKANEKALFAKHLENWIDTIVTENGENSKEVANKVKEGFQTMLRANIDYHRQMADALKDVNDDQHAMQSCHKLMAKVYESMCD